MHSFTELIDTYGRARLAEDMEIPVNRVRNWQRHNNIPADYWRELIELANVRGIGIDAAGLVEWAAWGRES